jgi:hypothetical protein
MSTTQDDLLSIPEFVRVPHQHTIVEDYLTEWKPIIAGFDDQTVDKLIRIIDSLKLQRAIAHRTELERLIDRTRGDLRELSDVWQRVQSGIVQMVHRGVQL